MWFFVFIVFMIVFVTAVLIHEMGWYKCYFGDHNFGRKAIWRLYLFFYLFIIWSYGLVVEVMKVIQ